MLSHWSCSKYITFGELSQIIDEVVGEKSFFLRRLEMRKRQNMFNFGKVASITKHKCIQSGNT